MNAGFVVDSFFDFTLRSQFSSVSEKLVITSFSRGYTRKSLRNLGENYGGVLFSSSRRPWDVTGKSSFLCLMILFSGELFSWKTRKGRCD